MKYSENDVCILHLSDLHIVNEGGKNKSGKVVIPHFLTKLLDDIKESTKSIDEIIIVVSGDIAFKAEYNTQKNAIIYFFRELRVKLDNKIKGIIFVPGNHDVQRKGYSSNYAIMSDENSDFNGLSGYNEYMEVTNSIKREYGFSSEKFSFGIEKIKCSDYNCCFIKADTAWCTTKGDVKQGEVILGQFQKKFLLNEYRALNPNPNFDITFFVSHYPMAWFTIDERETMLSLMMDAGKLNTDVILCGHIHDVDSLNYSTHDHSLMTLITGIGWPNNIDYKDNQERRYSIYKINPGRNTCDIIMRKSNRSGDFDFDYSLYTENREKDSKKIVYPLRAAHKNLAFIKLNSPSKIEEQNIHISPKVAGYIQKISDSLAFFNGHLTALIGRYKTDFFEKFCIWLDNEQEITKIQKRFSFFEGLSFDEVYDHIIDEVYFFLFENSEETFDTTIMKIWTDFCTNRDERNFYSFLDEICQFVLYDFLNCFPTDALIRTHFRQHSGKSDPDEYLAICSQTNSKNDESLLPKPLPWGGFVKAAFENKTSLVYSANKKLNNIQTDWQEFITIIPRFEGNIRKIKESQKWVERPDLTFGISVKCASELIDAVMTMSIMDFLKLEDQISNQLDEYVHIFGNPLKMMNV